MKLLVVGNVRKYSVGLTLAIKCISGYAFEALEWTKRYRIILLSVFVVVVVY